MNTNFYPSRLYPEDAQAQQWLAMQQQNGHQGQSDGQDQSQGMGMVNTASLGGLDNASVLAAMDGIMPLAREESLDDIVSQNTREFQRRRSIPQPFSDSLLSQDVHRRMSMMGFGSVADALQGFSFGFPDSAALAGTSGPFPQQGLVALPDQTGYATLPPDTVGMGAFANQDMMAMAADPASMGLFSPPDLQSQYPPTTIDTVSPDFAMNMGVENTPMSAPSVNPMMAGFTVGVNDGMMGAGETLSKPPTQEPPTQEPPSLIPNAGMGQFQPHISPPEPEPREPSVPASFHSPASTTSRAMSQSSAGRASIAAGTPASTAPTAAGPTLPTGLASRNPKKGVYSKSGFDMLKALFYVATRKNPTVEIGAVDMSCAFVVCDVTLNDCPIIYVSDNFQNLTGYNRYEIVGKNCRFLQSPDGQVEAGSKREFVANDAVFNMRNAIAERREIQQSLINYRKGGKPFLNLLTMIPIPWDSSEIRYYIGFQIDLVECPDAISSHDSGAGGAGGGAMQVNYRHSDIGQYFFSPPSTSHWSPDSGQTLSVDEVSSLIQHHNPATTSPPSEYHTQSWPKMLLENADDVIHVLSLKGLLLYLSPACKKLLEYDPSELVGTSLSSICHPSDIVPVTRELKDAAQHNPSSVNIAFRIRRKYSGYTWFESHGALVADQPSSSSSSSTSSGGGGSGSGGTGKGKKYIILVGRKRPVLSLRRRDVDAHSPAGVTKIPASGSGAGGGAVITDTEIWSKLSTSGMFLCVSSSTKPLLDLSPCELRGTSMQDLLRKESRAEFGVVVERARMGGGVVALRHELVHKRGQVLPAVTVLYPGDGQRRKGERPSFLIAQTRLVKAGSGRVIAPWKGHGHGHGNGAGGGVVVVPGEDAMGGVVATGGVPASSSSTMVMTVAGQDSNNTAADEEGSAGSGDEDDIFAELRTTRCTSWQYELRQMEKVNRLLAEELTQLMANKKKRKRRKGGGSAAGGNGSGGGGVVRDCANCHKRDTPEWRRGPSGNRDLCNSCGLRWAKQVCSSIPSSFSSPLIIVMDAD
jgi:PAS domain S-box-containing protein